MRSNKILFVLVTILMIIVSEFTLRSLGFKPGCYESIEKMKEININFDLDSIYPVNFFSPDSLGIIKIVRDYINYKNIGKDEMLLKYIYYFDSLKINRLGFRGDEFDYNREDKSILLCGDSYTWGYSALPIDSSFGDLLTKWLPNYKIYNAGLPGVDVVTYQKELECLLPILKPKIVIVNFFEGNDFIYFDKKLVPMVNNDLFIMNVGAIMKVNYDSYGKDSIEVFNTYLDAYNYLKNKFYVPESSIFTKIISNSSLFTQIYKVFFAKKKSYDNVKVTKFIKDDYATKIAILDIAALCLKHKAKLIISVIPDEYNINTTSFNLLKERLEKEFYPEVSYYLIEGLNADDYAAEKYDTHFNNSGHLKYANYLFSIINADSSILK